MIADTMRQFDKCVALSLEPETADDVSAKENETPVCSLSFAYYLEWTSNC
jgi:hypothetical protein